MIKCWTGSWEEALERFGRPEIFNTDQGSKFTGSDFAGVLQAHGTRISMNGRSLKYEAVYPHAIADGVAARRVIVRWLTFDNTTRPHSDLDGQTLAEAYETGPLHMMDEADALPPPPQAQAQ